MRGGRLEPRKFAASGAIPPIVSEPRLRCGESRCRRLHSPKVTQSHRLAMVLPGDRRVSWRPSFQLATIVIPGEWYPHPAPLDLWNFEHCLPDDRGHPLRENRWFSRCVRNASDPGCRIGSSCGRDHARVPQRASVWAEGRSDGPQLCNLDEPEEVDRVSTAQEPSSRQRCSSLVD